MDDARSTTTPYELVTPMRQRYPNEKTEPCSGTEYDKVEGNELQI